MWLPTGKHKSHLDEIYLPGVFLGIALHSNDIMVGKETGYVGLARSFRRLPESQRVDVMLLRGVRGVPWCPDPQVGAEVEVAVAPAPIVREVDLPPDPPPAAAFEPRRVYIRRVELMKHGFTPGCPGCEAVQAGTPPRGHTVPCRMRIETAMRGDKDGEARVARAEIAREISRAAACGSSMEIDTDIAPPLAAPAEPPSSSAPPMLGAETPSIGASSSRKRTAAEGGDETVTAMADSRGEPFQAVEMLELCAEHEQATGVLCSVNFVEVYNPVCFSKSAHTFKQSYGGVFDVRYGWDFSNAGIRDRCWAMLKELGPTLIIGSPLFVSMPIDALRAVDLDAAWSHLQFCMELYTWQLQRGKAFLHEQPCGAQCWNEPCMRKLIEMDGVECRRGDQCPFGPQVRGNDGARALALKPTISVSNCVEILDEVCERCSNNCRPRREWHKHTSTLTGTCSHAERYPVRLVRAILRGLRRALRRCLPGGGHLCEIESGPTLEERGPEEESAMLSSGPDPAEARGLPVPRLSSSMTSLVLHLSHPWCDWLGSRR